MFHQRQLPQRQCRSPMIVAALFLFVSGVQGRSPSPWTSKNIIQGHVFTGIQSGENDTLSSYAGGLVYHQGALYLTGATYGKQFFETVAVEAINPSADDNGLPTKFSHFCFVASIQASSVVASSTTTSTDPSLTSLTWQRRHQYVIDAEHSQACTTLTTSSATRLLTTAPVQPELYISGYHAEAHEDAQGQFDGGIDVGGIIYDSTLSTPKPTDFAVNVGEAEPALYPMAVVSVANETATALFIASMYSSTTTWNETAAPQDDTVDPTTTLVGAFGANYSMNVQKLVRSTTSGSTSWVTEWNQSYATHDGPSVHLVSSMLFLSKTFDGDADGVDLIIVGGSTTGYGLAFGANAQSSGADDMDGFVTKLNAETGLFPLEDGAKMNLSTTEFQFDATYSTRIQSQTNMNDHVMGLCHTPAPTDTSTSRASTVVYAVGTTQGTMAGTKAGGAFLIQLNVDTLKPNWKQQLSGVNVEGIACAVTPDGNHVYLGGNHPYGASLEDAFATERTRGRDLGASSTTTDIFVAQFNAFNGTLSWIQTIGAPDKDERLAQGNGLVTDEQGNVFVYGNTRGSLFRENVLRTNDVFVAFLSRDREVVLGKTNNYSFRKINGAVLFIVAALITMLLVGFYFLCRTRRPARAGKASRTMEEMTPPPSRDESPSAATPNGVFHDLQTPLPAIPVGNSALSNDSNDDNTITHVRSEPPSSSDFAHHQSIV